MKVKALFLFVLLAGLGVAAYFYGWRHANNEVANLPTLPSVPVLLPSPPPTPMSLLKHKELPITLPMLDALFFLDRQFSAELKESLLLTDEQIAQLCQSARAETTGLREANAGEMTTTAAGERAAERISGVLGDEKAAQFAEFALNRWRILGNQEGEIALADAVPLATITPLPESSPGASPSPEGSATPGVTPSPGRSANEAAKPAAAALIPLDSRIVVNAPAYRLDVFQAGQLIKSYKTTIGYPEFPLPTGIRKASSIIFNPTWTPPDEPWVESSKTVKVGQTVAAGDKLNPLGPIKIPIGLPSLIHGGKTVAKLGTFGSHGCVGLTDRQVQDFAKLLGQLGGVEITDEQIAERARKRTETKVVTLKQTIPVELRYDTITVEDGALHIYRDVYDRDTNTQENLEAVLSAYGVSYADLSQAERTQIEQALLAMSRAPAQPTGTALTAAQKAEQRQERIQRQQLTRQFKGKKEVVIELAALAGKGYPAAVELDTGVPAKKAASPKAPAGKAKWI